MEPSRSKYVAFEATNALQQSSIFTAWSGTRRVPPVRSHQRILGEMDPLVYCCVESLLLKQNPTLTHLRHVKSFLSRAARKVPRCQKWDCHALPLFAVDTAIPKLFSISTFNNRRDQKRAHQIHKLERVATLFLGLRHDARNAPSFKSSPKTMKPQQTGRMTQTSMCWTGEDRLWESKFYMPFQPPKTGIKQIEQFNDIILHILLFLAESSGVTKLELFQLFPHCQWSFSRCTDSARLRQDSATKDIKTGTKLW